MVDAPHDFLIGGNYSSKGDETEGARLPRGDGWYRKHFALPSEWRGRAVWLYFEGIWQHSLMWLNGCVHTPHSQIVVHPVNSRRRNVHASLGITGIELSLWTPLAALAGALLSDGAWCN